MKRLLLPLLAVAACTVAVSAQETPKTETLLIALKSDKTAEGVKETLQNALSVTAKDVNTPVETRGAFEALAKGGLTVEPISVELYNAYGRLGDSGFRAAELPLLKSKSGAMEVRQLETATPGVRRWELILTGEGNPRLSKLSVKYKGEEKPTEYDNPNSIKKDAEVRYSSPGRYVLTLPTGGEKGKEVARTPESFTAKIETGASADPTVTTEEGQWPTSQGYYLVTMKDFPTNTDAKQNFVNISTKTERLGGSALKSLNVKKNVTVATGDARSTDGIPEIEDIDGNKFFLKVPVLVQKDAAQKAFVLFPLTLEAAEAKVKELDEKNKNKTAKWTAEYVRDNKDEGGLSVFTEKDADPTIELGKDGVKPRWYDLRRMLKTRVTDDPQVRNLYRYNLNESSEYFGRAINLVKPEGKLSQDDAKTLRGAFKDGTAYGVVVYIFERDGLFNAVPAPRGKPDQPVTYAVVRQFDEWGRALKPIANGEVAPGNEPKAPPKKEEK